METVLSQDGTCIAYHKTGSGPPLLLVHGATADHSRWAAILPALEEDFTVYAMDRRGRGGSGDAAQYHIQREFEDIAALVDAIGDSVNLLGHSFGALCSLEAAKLTPNIGRLILYEPPPPGVKETIPPEVAARLQSLLDAGDRDSVIGTFMREVARIPPHEVEKLRALPSWAGRVAAAHTIPREIDGLEAQPPFDPASVESVKMPVQLLLGGDSSPLYAEFTRQLHAALPNSKIVVMPGQQHVAMNTAPELFVDAVFDFLTVTANEPLQTS